MPRIPFTDLASAPEFKALPLEEQQTVASNYWDEVAAEQPDRAELFTRMRDASKSLIDLKAKRADAAPVQRRSLDAQVEGLAFDLSLGDNLAQGALTPEGYNEALKVRDADRAERQARLDKTASLFTPEVQRQMAPAMDALMETAARGGVFGSARLDARAADVLPGGQKDVVSSSKSAYEALRNQMAADFNLEPAEVDDMVKHQLNLQEEPVSRDAFGTLHIKDEVIAAGPKVAAEAINNSNLPWSVKQELVKDLPAKIDRFRSGVLERVRTETPELAKELGIDQTDDELGSFQKLVKNLNDTRKEQFAGGIGSAALGTLDFLGKMLPLPSTEAQIFEENAAIAGAPAFVTEAEKTSAAGMLQKKVDMVNQLSSQFNKSKTEIWGTDAAAFGSGAYSVAEAVGLSLATAGTGAAIPLTRIATMGKTGARLAGFANRAIATSPVAGFVGAKTAAQTYEQAIGAGKTEDEAFDLAARSGAIEAGVTMLFSGIGLGGTEDVGQMLAGGALRQSARESAKSAYRMFGEKLALGIAGEQLEENLITALDAVTVQAKIDPTMTVDDFKKQLRDTALVTLAVSGPTVGAGALRETLAAKPTYQKTDDELQLEADLNLVDASTAQPGEADIPPAGQGPADAAEDGGAPAPRAPEPVAPGGEATVVGTEPGGTEVAAQPAGVPGVPTDRPAEPVLVPDDAGVTPTPTTDEKQIEETSGLPPVEGQPVEPSPAVQAEEGVAQREGEGAQETTPSEPTVEVAPLRSASNETEPPGETFREDEPDWNTVFETLRDREPETRQVNTESPKFKALVAELKNQRVAEAAGRMAQRRADIVEMRNQAEADRVARNKERLRRNREKRAAKPLDKHEKRIKEITGLPTPAVTTAMVKWMKERGYTGPFDKGSLKVMLRLGVRKKESDTERDRALYDAQTQEVKDVLEAIYHKGEKSAEEIPVFRKFAETEIGEKLLEQPIRSLSSFREAGEPIPVEYEELIENRIKAHVQSRIFTRDPNGRTIADVVKALNERMEGQNEGSMIDTGIYSAADIVQAINDLSEGKVKSQEDFDAEMERQLRESEDRTIAFAEQQLAAAESDAQVVDLAEVREGDVFTMGGVDYTAVEVVDQDGRTESFTLRGKGPLNRTEVTEDFFVESVTPTSGSLAGVDPAEVEAFRVAQETPEAFEGEPDGPMSYSPEALKEAFAVSDEQAVAMDALVRAMGLDTSRIQLQRGGVPGSAAMRQEMDARDAEYLAAVERGDMEAAQRMVFDRLVTLDNEFFSNSSWAARLNRLAEKRENGGRESAFAEANRKDAEIAAKKAEPYRIARTQALKALPQAFVRLKKGRRFIAGVLDIQEGGGIDFEENAAPYQELAGALYKTGDTQWLLVESGKIERGTALLSGGLNVASGSSAKAIVEQFQRRELAPSAYRDESLESTVSAENPLSIVGIKLEPDDVVDSADPVTRDADGNVIPLSRRFNPESPSILYQGEAKGSFEMIPETGDILLRGFKASDVSTGVHEIAHAARRMLLNRALPQEFRKGITDEDITIAEGWAGAENGVWTVDAEEKFARGMERYLRDGKAPVSSLQAVFDKIGEWLRSVYTTVAGSPIDVEISDAMQAVFDKLLSRTLTPLPQPASQAAPIEPTPAPQPARAPPAEEDLDVTGIQNAQTDRLRVKAGLPPRFAPARQGNEEAWDAAMARINRKKSAARELVNELKTSPRSIDPIETAMFTHELLVRSQTLDEALAAYNENPNSDTDAAVREAQAAETDAILTAEQIGTIEGRALQARKILIHQDFSFARMAAQTQKAQGGKPLSADQSKEIQDLHKRLQEVQQQLAVANEQIAKAEAERVFVNVQVEFKKSLREATKRGEKSSSFIDRQAEAAKARILARKREGRLNALPVDELLDHAIVGVSYLKNGLVTLGEFTTQLVKDFGRKVLPFAGDIFAKSQELYESAAPTKKVKPREDILSAIEPDAALDSKAIFQLVRYYINEGLEGFEPVMDAVLKDLKEFYPDLTLREVHDAYSKYGQVITPSKEEDLKLAREYQALSRLQSQLEDAQKGLAPLKTGLQRDPATQRVRELTKQVKDTMRKLGIRPTTEEGQLKSSFEAIKTRLSNEIEDLTKAVVQREERKAREPQKFTPEEAKELKDLRQRRDDLKQDYNAVFQKKGLTFEEQLDRAEKLLDRRINEEYEMLRLGILQRNRDIAMGPWTPMLRARKLELDKLKADRRERQKAARPKKPEDLKDYERKLASLDRRIKEEEELLAAGLTARQKDFKMGRWSPELAERQAQLDAMRDARRELAKSRRPVKSQEQTAYERSVRAIQAAIDRYNDIINEVTKPGKVTFSRTIDAEMKALIDQRDALRDAAAEVLEADPARRDKRKQDLLQTLYKSINEITRKIQDGDFSTKAKTGEFANDPDVAKVRASRDALNKTLAAMRREKLPKKSPEEIRISRDQKLLQGKIDKLKDRLARGDYSKPVKLPPVTYQGRDALVKQKRDLESEFNENLLKLELANRSTGRKIFDNTTDVVFGVSRAMLTSFDAGAFGRQAGVVNFMRPGLAIKNFPANFAFREKTAAAYEAKMESDPKWARAQAAKLALTSWRPGSSLSDMEEVYRSRIAKKIPGVAASERAYVTYLNVVRFSYFNALADALPITEQTEDNLKRLATFVNTATGRGGLGKFEAAAATLASVFFSPKYWWSRLQLLGGMIYHPLDAMTGFRLGPKETRAARKIVAQEFGRLSISLGVVFSLLAFAKHAFDLDDEEFMVGTDPRSSDFGKVRIGDTRIDFMAGLLQNVVFLSRIASGEKVTAGGEVTALSGPDAKFKETRLGETIRLLRTKLSPAAGSIANALDGADVVGNKFNWETEILGSYIPMSMAETYSSMRELGVGAGAAAGLSSFIGIGAATYGGEEDYVIEQDIMTGVFGVDQARYDKEVKEKGYTLPKAKPLPKF